MSVAKTVFIVDDEALLRDSVCALVTSMGATAIAFASAEEFLTACRPDQRGVVVTDLRMPGLSGLELQAELARRDLILPVIVLTAYARTPSTVQAIQAGAVTMIDKPYHDDELWNAVRSAFVREEELWDARQHREGLRARWRSLSPEEQRVAELIVAGQPNKAVAEQLGLALRTVEKRRHAVFAKMQAESLPDLVRLLGSL